jgi:hypothetical protein
MDRVQNIPIVLYKIRGIVVNTVNYGTENKQAYSFYIIVRNGTKGSVPSNVQKIM